MLQTVSRQVGFFDAAELIGPLPAGSFYALLAEHGDRIASGEEFRECYASAEAAPRSRPLSWPR
jgi:hypothetical protein